MFTLPGRQGFLLLSTHRLNAEDGPLSLARAPAARRAFLPLANPPPNTSGQRGNSLTANGLPLIKNSYNYCSANAAHLNMFSTTPLAERMINFTVFTLVSAGSLIASVFTNAENIEALMNKIWSGGEADTPYVMFYKLIL